MGIVSGYCSRTWTGREAIQRRLRFRFVDQVSGGADAASGGHEFPCLPPRPDGCDPGPAHVRDHAVLSSVPLVAFRSGPGVPAASRAIQSRRTGPALEGRGIGREPDPPTDRAGASAAQGWDQAGGAAGGSFA